MAYKLIVQVEAIVDIQEAFEWYEQQKDNLGFELIDEIEACYDKIVTHPERYSFINPLYRRIKTDRFPFVIIFEIEDDLIIVNSVRHAKRKPI